MGFAPVFWLKMGFLDELSRGLFIASMIALSSGTCYATIFMQRRYVCAVIFLPSFSCLDQNDRG